MDAPHNVLHLPSLRYHFAPHFGGDIPFRALSTLSVPALKGYGVLACSQGGCHVAHHTHCIPINQQNARDHADYARSFILKG